MTEEEKAQIDGMSYEDMLRRIRFDPIGSPFFNSSTEFGRHTFMKWQQLCCETPLDERVVASKSIGWGEL